MERVNSNVREGDWMAQHMLMHVEDIRPVSTPILHINTPHAETGFRLVSTHTLQYVGSHEVMLLHFMTQHTQVRVNTQLLCQHTSGGRTIRGCKM